MPETIPKDVEDKLRRFAAKQTYLDPVAAKVLYDNLWELYDGTPIPSTPEVVNLTYATGDSPKNLFVAAADIISDEMDMMDVDNFETQVRYRNYKRVRDALRSLA